MSVIGRSIIPDPIEAIVEDPSRLFAQRDHTVVCGSLGGAIEAVCYDTKDVGGMTIDVLPGEDRENTNSYVDIPIAAGLGHARDALAAMSGDTVIAVDGGGGTLSEIGYTNVFDHPTVDIRIQQAGPLEGSEPCDSPETAVAFVEDAV